MDCNMPGFPVLHHLLEFAQAHVCWIGDAIQPSHSPSSPPPPALSLFHQQDLFQWVDSLHQVATVWSFSFNISPSNEYLIDFLLDWLVRSPCSSQDSQESSPIPQFESIDSLALSLLYGLPLTLVHDSWKNHTFDYMELCQQSDVFVF